MKYFKVKETADQTRKNVNKTDILIKNELYTEKELNKFVNKNTVFTESYFDVVNVSKNKTYFFFGARFNSN